MDVKDGELVLKASGWEHLYIPEPSVSNYAITGHESQVISMELQPGESLQGEPGTMMYLSHGIQQGVSCEGFMGRCCSGEACYVVNYTNESEDSNKAYVALTPNYPTAKVVPVDMSSPNINGALIAQQGAYMASYGNVEIDISLDCNLCRCCCSGLGLVRQKLSGDGTAFLAATGTIVQKVLGAGETILVDTNCVLAFAESCKLDLRRAGGIIGMFGGGEGIFNTTLTGPGLVIIQSMNETMFKDALAADKMYRR